MPAWNDYKKMAKARGSLALELYVIESRVADSADAVKANLQDHLAYQQSLEKSGQLAFAGPLSDESGELMQGNGMIIYRAASMDEARELASQDPMHIAGARTFTLRRWLINEGSLSLSVGLSTDSVTLS